MAPLEWEVTGNSIWPALDTSVHMEDSKWLWRNEGGRRKEYIGPRRVGLTPKSLFGDESRDDGRRHRSAEESGQAGMTPSLTRHGQQQRQGRQMCPQGSKDRSDGQDQVVLGRMSACRCLLGEGSTRQGGVQLQWGREMGSAPKEEHQA